MDKYETLRRTKDYIVVREAFKEDCAGTINCLIERLTGLGQLINIYESEMNRISFNKEKQEILMEGVDETLKAGKMITKWINKLKKDFPEYDFSVYPDLLNVVSKMENINP